MERKRRDDDDIHSAARNGDLISVELIISSNSLSLNSRDKHSRTPLHLAAWAGHTRVVTALCKHKADVGAAAMDDMAAIHFAAQKGHLDVVKVLVSSGVSVQAANRKGMTALHYAAQGSHVELTKYLLKKGANIAAKTKAGKTPLDLASKDEIRLLFSEHEKAKQIEAQDGENKAADEVQTDGDTGGATSEEKVEVKQLDESNAENLKRKGDKDGAPDNLSKPKKSKVTLNHLLASDDTQEDEEE